MKTPVLVVLPLLAAAATSACSSATRSGTSESPSGTQASAQSASAPTAPCTAAVRGVDVSSWESVAADGFTFCLPASWNGRNGTVRQGSTSLSWGTGSPPQRRVAVVRAEVRRAGEPPSPQLLPGSEARRFTEEIDGRTATLWRNRFERT